MQEISYQNRF